MMASRIVLQPETEPVTLVQAKAHVRVTSTASDSLITTFIKAARRAAERFTGRALIDQTWDVFLDEFPEDEIELPKPPLIVVEGVFYRDADGVEQELSTDDYVVANADDEHLSGRVVLAATASWPTIQERPNAVRVRLRAGYLDATTSPAEAAVPEDIQTAILLHVGHLYAHRETVVVGETVSELPMGTRELLRPYRVLLGMA